jgi:hypothetical protein
MSHYHIRWDDGKLDWEAFRTEDEAKAAARQLMRLDETYVIEQLDGECPRCASLQSERLSRQLS